jgi:hypothetical protein
LTFDDGECLIQSSFQQPSFDEEQFMNPRHSVFAVAILVMGSVFCTSATAGIAHLTLQSQAGDFIGQGFNFDINYDTADGANVAAVIRKTLPDGSPAELDFLVDQNNLATNTVGLLFFGTDQLGIPFQAGTYGLPGNTAQRADFAQPDHPGLDVSFQNRGSNTVTGNFTVNSVSFFTDSANTLHVGSLDVSFEQHSEGAAPALFGTFVYRAQPAQPVPEPSSLALVGSAAIAGLGLWARRRKLKV